MLSDPLEVKTSEDIASANNYLSHLEKEASYSGDASIDNNSNNTRRTVLVTLGSSMIELVDPNANANNNNTMPPSSSSSSSKPRGGSGTLESVASATPSPVPRSSVSGENAESGEEAFKRLVDQLDEEFAREMFLEVFQKSEREVEL